MMRRALTLIECVVALVIVSVMLVAALNTVGARAWGSSKTAAACEARAWPTPCSQTF